jgi:hypothetical protein
VVSTRRRAGGRKEAETIADAERAEAESRRGDAGDAAIFRLESAGTVEDEAGRGVRMFPEVKTRPLFNFIEQSGAVFGDLAVFRPKV